MSFNEENVNRDTGGRFDNKPQSAAEATLTPAVGTAVPTALDRALQRRTEAAQDVLREAIAELREVGRTVPGAARVVLEYVYPDGGNEDSPGFRVEYRRVVDSAGNTLDVDYDTENHLEWLPWEMNAVMAAGGGYFDGQEALTCWVDLTATPTDARDNFMNAANEAYQAFFDAKDRLLREGFPPALALAVREVFPDAKALIVESYTADGSQEWFVPSIELADGTTLDGDEDDESKRLQFESASEAVTELLSSGAQSADDLEWAGAESLGGGMYRFALQGA